MVVRLDDALRADPAVMEQLPVMPENAQSGAPTVPLSSVARFDVGEGPNQISRAERTLVGQLGREPTAEEIGAVAGLPASEVEDILRSAQPIVSLEKPVGEDEESEFGRFLADETSIAPEVAAEQSLRDEALRDVLDQLSYRERRVLELRYGLGGEKPRTLDELGRMFNVTRERIRQVEHQSLQKLASMAEANRLS